MSGFNVLSVDTAYDESSAAFANSRKELYASLQGSTRVVSLSFADANRANLFRMLNRANSSEVHCHALVVSSHGTPGTVLDDSDSPEGILFSQSDSDEELALIGKNRSVYICACESGSGDLVSRLVDNGSRLVVAYRDKPSWNSAETAMMWRDFDKDIVKCLIYRQGMDGVLMHRDQCIRVIDDNFEYYDDYGKEDLLAMKSVLQTMEVVG